MDALSAGAPACIAGGAPAAPAPLPALGFDLGRQAYAPVWHAMQRFTDARGEDTVDELWLVEEGRVAPFEGDLEDYAKRLRTGTTPAPQADEERSVSRKAQKRLEAEERNRRFARRKDLEARLKAAEKEVEKLSGSRKALENRLAAPDLYGEDRKEDGDLPRLA